MVRGATRAETHSARDDVTYVTTMTGRDNGKAGDAQRAQQGRR